MMTTHRRAARALASLALLVCACIGLGTGTASAATNVQCGAVVLEQAGFAVNGVTCTSNQINLLSFYASDAHCGTGSFGYVNEYASTDNGATIITLAAPASCSNSSSSPTTIAFGTSHSPPYTDVYINTANSSGGGGTNAIHWQASPPTTPPTTCSVLGPAQAGWAGGTLRLLVGWGNASAGPVQTAVSGVNHMFSFGTQASPPSTGLGTLLGYIDTGDLIAGTVNQTVLTYAVDSAQSSKPASLRIVYLASPGCYVDVQIGSTLPTLGPIGDNGGEDSSPPSSSSSCGFSLNPLHYIKCLFWPSSGVMTQWSARVDSLKSHPPINVVVAGVQVVSDTLTVLQCPAPDPAHPNNICAGISTSTAGYSAFCDQSGTHCADLLQSAGQSMQTTTGGRVIYTMLETAVWVGFAFLVWRRISASVGGKG